MLRAVETDYVTLTEDEWKLVYRHLFSKRRRLAIAFALLGGLMLGLGFAFQHALTSVTGLTLKLAGGGIIGAGLGDFLYMNWWIQKHLRDPKNATLLGPSKATVDEKGISTESANGLSSTFPWETLTSVTELSEMRLVKIANIQGAVVMLRRSHSAEDWDMLSRWLAEKVRTGA
jgi:hypothetical protein